ncbi:hypothetical protein D910_11508, partial [Dendroctonus ponderosae]
NLLFYYENKDKRERPLGIIFLEGSYVERVIYSDSSLLPPTPEKSKDKEREKAEKVEKEKEYVDRNVAVERLIVEGCDILLDVKQIFVRQGTLIQIPKEKQKEKVAFKGFKMSSKSDKELVRQCFLFSYHLIITTSIKKTILYKFMKIIGGEAVYYSFHTDELVGLVQYPDIAQKQATETAHLAMIPRGKDHLEMFENNESAYFRADFISSKHLTATNKAKFARFYNYFAIDEDEPYRRHPSSQVTPERRKSVAKSIFIKVNSYEETQEEVEQQENNLLSIPKVEPSSSNDTLTGLYCLFHASNRFMAKQSVMAFVNSDTGPDPCGNCGQDLPMDKLTVEQRRRRDIVEEKRTARRKSEDRRKSDSARQDEPSEVSQEVRRKSDVTAERKKSLLCEDIRNVFIEQRTSEISERIRLEERRRIDSAEKKLNKSLEDRKRPLICPDERKRSSVDSGSSVVKISEERRKSGEDERKKNIYRHISSPRMERKTDRAKSLSIDSDTHPEEGLMDQLLDLEEKSDGKTDDVARTSIASVQASTQIILGASGENHHRQAVLLLEDPVSNMNVLVNLQVKQEWCTAFAIATCAADNPVAMQYQKKQNQVEDKTKSLEFIISTAATMRVLNVLRHWISKQGKDFEADKELKRQTKEFLEEIRCHPNLTSAEHKSAAQLLLLLEKQNEEERPVIDLVKLLRPPLEPSKERIESLSALEIAEQLTYIDHQIFMQIAPEELMGHSWLKPDKEKKALHVVMMTKRFNDVSRLIASEIVRKSDMVARVETIEKWAAVADIVRCLHNFNGVLQICSAFANAAIFRLKNTWERVSKTAKQSIEKHQKIVSSDGRFRMLRDALHKCDPPCIPYLGVYLTDLSFIEEGTPNFVDNNLLNFSKMRMIAHIIREIRQYQQTSYKIDLVTRVSNYLLDTSLLMEEEELFKASLKIEPRTPRLTTQSSIGKS